MNKNVLVVRMDNQDKLIELMVELRHRTDFGMCSFEFVSDHDHENCKERWIYEEARNAYQAAIRSLNVDNAEMTLALAYVNQKNPSLYEEAMRFARGKEPYKKVDTQDRARLDGWNLRWLEATDETLLPFRDIGYTAEECERDMRRMTNGERGCANPDEHEGSASPHMEGVR